MIGLGFYHGPRANKAFLNAAIIQTLWVGASLSRMEQLSLASFLHFGHEVHLYVYEPIAGVPPGVVVRDAAEILPQSDIFTYTGIGSYAGFANFFRYKLLLERGGWWIDADMVAVAPFDFEEPYVFSSEEVNGAAVPNVGALKVPAGSAVMEYAWEFCRRADPATLRWGQTGPALILQAVAAAGLAGFVQTPSVFCPVGYAQWRTLIEPDAGIRLPSETRAVHLWNEMWRRSELSKDGVFPQSSLYETLKRRFGVGGPCVSY